MDDVIKTIKNFNDNENNDFFSELIERLLYQQINEMQYINIINSLITNNYNLSKIREIRSIVHTLKNKELFNAYKFTLICYIKSKYESDIIKKIKKFKYIKNIKNTNFKYINTINTTDQLINNRENLRNIIKYLDSYNVTHIDKIHFEYINELVQRLQNLVKMFGLKFMASINIEIKDNYEIMEYDNEKFISYYKTILKLLKKYFEKVEYLVKKYIDISYIFVKSKSTEVILFNLAKYEKVLDKNIEIKKENIKTI